MLNKMDRWINEIPPIDQPQRFGNKAFRTWFERLKEVSGFGFYTLLNYSVIRQVDRIVFGSAECSITSKRGASRITSFLHNRIAVISH